jgi:hypothetical protein
MGRVDLTELINLRLQIEKVQMKYEQELTRLTEQYNKRVAEVVEQNAAQMARVGEIYDLKNDIALKADYADREINTEKLYSELPDTYWKCAHIPSKELCEYHGRTQLEHQIRYANADGFRKIAKITIEDAKRALTKDEFYEYLLPRNVVGYKLDLKIR